MAKDKGNGGTRMVGPFYSPVGQSLGGTKPGGPQGGKSAPDPLGLTHGIVGNGPGAESGPSQKHEK